MRLKSAAYAWLLVEYSFHLSSKSKHARSHPFLYDGASNVSYPYNCSYLIWSTFDSDLFVGFVYVQTVVFCLVDIYIMLGKAFLPYLEGLNSTQLRLVTIYANRISQARSGAAVDANHG